MSRRLHPIDTPRLLLWNLAQSLNEVSPLRALKGKARADRFEDKPADAPVPVPPAAKVKPTADRPFDLALASHWAPVWYQDTHAHDPKGDLITAIDFDGDFVSNNNWENSLQKDADTRPVIYHSVIETKTHAFIQYLDFHPRDWSYPHKVGKLTGDPCHENDLEGAMVVVEKDGSRFGKFSLLITQAHGQLNVYTNDERVKAKFTPFFKKGQRVLLEEGSHPALYVEEQGHGVYPLPPAAADRPFRNGDGIVYRLGDEAKAPTHTPSVTTYALRSFQDEIWPHRSEVGPGKMWDDPMSYRGIPLGKKLDGDDHKVDGAKPPWGWFQGPDLRLRKGDYFFRPAETIRSWLRMPTEISTEYVHNPYLAAAPRG